MGVLPCGNTYTNSINPYTGITAVNGVYAYKVNCYNTSTSALVGTKTFTSNYIYIKQIPGMVYNTNYYWTVECQYHNGTAFVFGPESNSTCGMRWGAASSIMINDEDNLASRLSGINPEEENIQSVVLLYPNPNNGSFNIELGSASQVVITNALGQVVLNGFIETGKTGLDIHDQPSGIYFVKVIQNGKQKTLKLIKE